MDRFLKNHPWLKIFDKFELQAVKYERCRHLAEKH